MAGERVGGSAPRPLPLPRARLPSQGGAEGGAGRASREGAAPLPREEIAPAAREETRGARESVAFARRAAGGAGAWRAARRGGAPRRAPRAGQPERLPRPVPAPTPRPGPRWPGASLALASEEPAGARDALWSQRRAAGPGRGRGRGGGRGRRGPGRRGPGGAPRPPRARLSPRAGSPGAQSPGFRDERPRRPGPRRPEERARLAPPLGYARCVPRVGARSAGEGRTEWPGRGGGGPRTREGGWCLRVPGPRGPKPPRTAPGARRAAQGRAEALWAAGPAHSVPDAAGRPAQRGA